MAMRYRDFATIPNEQETNILHGILCLGGRVVRYHRRRYAIRRRKRGKDGGKIPVGRGVCPPNYLAGEVLSRECVALG